jgi:hypothetical protein
MRPGVRKLFLTLHVTCSVGWLGAVATFLALAWEGLASPDPGTVRASYLAANTVTWWVIVPASFASLLTGVVQALGTPWGLFRHYWVLAKLILNLLASGLLLLHTQPIGGVARAAAEMTLGAGDLRSVRIQLFGDAIAAVLVLLAATALSVYKPRGLTRLGWRQQHAG